MSMFTPATRSLAKARIGIAGPSGAGKTYTGLTIASGLVGPEGSIAVIDTERGSASLYAGDFQRYDIKELHPPFKTINYLEAIRGAADGKYDVCMIDSITHAWKGTGGVLDEVDKQKARQHGNDFTAWNHGDKLWQSLIDAILAAPLHVIVTMRSKMEYVLEEDSRGKTVPRKVGMAPEARAGLEYEFTMIMDMDLDHRAVVTKTRIHMFADEVWTKPGPDVGERIAAWLGDGNVSAEDRRRFDEATEPVEHDRLLAELEDWIQFVPQERHGQARAYARKGVAECRETIEKARALAPPDATESRSKPPDGQGDTGTPEDPPAAASG